MVEMNERERKRFSRRLILVCPFEVDLSPGSPFRIRFRLPGEPHQSDADLKLSESVERLGLLHPPLVVKSGRSTSGGYTAVYGHRRIAAALVRKLDKIQVAAAEALPESALLLSMRVEEAAHGPELSGLEKIIAVQKILDFPGISPEEAAALASSIFGRRISLRHAERVTGLLRLKDETLVALHEGGLTIGDLLELDSHPVLSTDQAASLLAGRRLTRGQQRRAVRLMLYLADQGEDKWNDFMESPFGKGESLLPALHARCYPSLKEDLEEFRRVSERIGLPSEASITPPPNLEGGDLELRIRITGPDSLAGILSKLEDSLENGDIDSMLDILRGKRP